MNWTRRQLKEMARTALHGSYWKSVFVAFLLSLAAASFASSGAVSTDEVTEFTDSFIKYMPIIMLGIFLAGSMGLALRIFLFRPLEVGCRNFFLQDIYYPAELDCLKAGFSGNYWNVVWIMFCRDIFIVLWTMLLIIPGIIKSYEYKMIPYILAENPNISRQEAFALSKQMMYGDKWNTFVLELSFIGWAFLTLITFGVVGIFYYQPYLALTDAALYQALKEKVGGYNNGGYDNGGYDNGSYNNGGYDNSGYNNGGYDNGGYNNGGYGNGGYSNGGYDNGGYNNGNYNNGGYSNGGYDNSGYSNGGYDYNSQFDNSSFGNDDAYGNAGSGTQIAPVDETAGDDSYASDRDAWGADRNSWAEDGRQNNPWDE